MSEVIGKIEIIKNTIEVSGSFKKREFVVTSSEQYPQSILMEMTQDKCDLLNQFKVGDDVNVSYNLRGRSWTNPQGEVKWFNTIQAWKISKITDSPSTVENYQAKVEPLKAEPMPEDDLPF